MDKLVDPVTYGCSDLSINCGHSVIGPSKKGSVLHQMFDPATQKANNLCFFRWFFLKEKNDGGCESLSSVIMPKL